MTPCITAISSRICTSMASCRPGAGFDSAGQCVKRRSKFVCACAAHARNAEVFLPMSPNRLYSRPAARNPHSTDAAAANDGNEDGLRFCFGISQILPTTFPRIVTRLVT
jgi:hypothetical protein